MEIFDSDGVKRAVQFSASELQPGLSFFSEDKDFIQVGAWRYPSGKELAKHSHNYLPRQITHTQEFIFIVKGSLKASIFDSKKVSVTSLILRQGDGLVLLSGGHGYEILSEDTVVIECKNGPYKGADKDRTRF